MARLIFYIIGVFVFGVIYTEILNGLKLFDFSIPVYGFAGFISLVFLFLESIMKYFEARSSRSDADEARYRKFRDYCYKWLALLGFVLLIALPFIWWGAIKRLAVMAEQGIR